MFTNWTGKTYRNKFLLRCNEKNINQNNKIFKKKHLWSFVLVSASVEWYPVEFIPSYQLRYVPCLLGKEYVCCSGMFNRNGQPEVTAPIWIISINLQHRDLMKLKPLLRFQAEKSRCVFCFAFRNLIFSNEFKINFSNDYKNTEHVWDSLIN